MINKITKEEAKAFKAFSKLLKFRKDWIKDWEPNWEDNPFIKIQIKWLQFLQSARKQNKRVIILNKHYRL